MGFLASFIKNNYGAIFAVFVLLVMLYALSLVLTSDASSPEGDVARWLRIISAPRLSG